MMRSRQAGFTLLEVLLALSVAALTLTLAFATVVSLRGTLQRVQSAMMQTVREEQVLTYLENAIRSATLGLDAAKLPRPPRIPPQEWNPTAHIYNFVVEDRSFAGKDSSEMVFASMSQPTDNEALRRSALMTMRVSVQDAEDGSDREDLVLELDRTPFRSPPDEELDEVVLFEGVAGFRVSCVEAGSDDWQENWDAWELGNRLPAAVRIEVELLDERRPDAEPRLLERIVLLRR